MRLRRTFSLILLCGATAFAAMPSTVHAQKTKAKNEKVDGGDLRAYLGLVESLKGMQVQEQVDRLRDFLDENPSTSFRTEIESNIEQLENLITATDPSRRQEKRDAERYLRAVEFAKSLSPQDQMALWEQFLEENPKSLYRREAEINLQQLRKKYGQPSEKPEQRSSLESPPIDVRRSAPVMVVEDPGYKSSEFAVMLATFGGLVVPGAGHWYTEDYVIAGVLSAVRVGALGVGIPGLIFRNTLMIVSGSILYGFSYLADAIDTPFAVRRYNDALDQKILRQRGQLSWPVDVRSNDLEIAWTISF